MNATITIDKAGRLVLPKPMRDEMQLCPGDSLELQSSEDGILLRPARTGAGMKKEQGVWVFDSGKPLTEDMVRRTRHNVLHDRERKILGLPR
jgi:AbrB family looped-hinge helix DNA binding protein